MPFEKPQSAVKAVHSQSEILAGKGWFDATEPIDSIDKIGT